MKTDVQMGYANAFKKGWQWSFSSMLTSCLFGTLVWGSILDPEAYAQNNQAGLNDAFIGNNSNQNNINQNINQNQNIVNFPDRVISPLNSSIYTPANTENDFGFNFSAGVNTLDASNVTLYLGVVYQPGRTASHRARMQNLLKQTEILEVQKQTLEARLKLLQKQVKDAGLQLEQMQGSVPDAEAGTTLGLNSASVSSNSQDLSLNPMLGE